MTLRSRLHHARSVMRQDQMTSTDTLNADDLNDQKAKIRGTETYEERFTLTIPNSANGDVTNVLTVFIRTIMRI